MNIKIINKLLYPLYLSLLVVILSSFNSQIINHGPNNHGPNNHGADNNRPAKERGQITGEAKNQINEEFIFEERKLIIKNNLTSRSLGCAALIFRKDDGFNGKIKIKTDYSNQLSDKSGWILINLKKTLIIAPSDSLANPNEISFQSGPIIVLDYLAIYLLISLLALLVVARRNLKAILANFALINLLVFTAVKLLNIVANLDISFISVITELSQVTEFSQITGIGQPNGNLNSNLIILPILIIIGILRLNINDRNLKKYLSCYILIKVILVTLSIHFAWTTFINELWLVSNSIVFLANSSLSFQKLEEFLFSINKKINPLIILKKNRLLLLIIFGLTLFGANILFKESYKNSYSISDSAHILNHAKAVAKGRLVADSSDQRELNITYGSINLDRDRWISAYPPASIFAIALFEKLRIVDFYPALLGALSMIALYFFALNITSNSHGIALASVLFFILSPLFRIIFAEHTTHALSILLGVITTNILFKLINEPHKRRTYQYALLLALLSGILFLCRPLTSFAFIIPILVSLFFFQKKLLLPYSLLLTSVMSLYLVYNLLTTGDAFTFSYNLAYPGKTIVGFGATESGEHTFSRGISIISMYLLATDSSLLALGIPALLALCFINPRELGTKSLIALSPFLLLSILHIFYNINNLVYGPRFLSEGAILLLPFIAIGISRLMVYANQTKISLLIIIFILNAFLSNIELQKTYKEIASTANNKLLIDYYIN